MLAAGPDAVRKSGVALRLPPQSIRALSMALHFFALNAKKFL
jgi:hypothetical protein